ncbi:MAG: S8 family serine peptidase [Chlorobi bacterium]|nr:S8 family serine peptidase [Chlorobiota bacterium]
MIILDSTETSIQGVAKGPNQKLKRSRGGKQTPCKTRQLKNVLCQTCSSSTPSSSLKALQDYNRQQLTLIYFHLLQSTPGLTPDALVCADCVERAERATQQKQIVRLRGEPHFVDLALGSKPILSTPLRMNSPSRFTGKGVTIAFVDSGFAPHPDLILPVNRVLAVYDAVKEEEVHDFERDFSEEPPIEAWHGTMAATVAAGSGHLSEGYYRGIASDARLVLVKTMTVEHRVQTSQVQRALEWILKNYRKYNIQIVNFSLGVDETTRSMQHPVISLVEELTRKEVVVVAASGNNPSRPLVPPGSAPSAITVGGYDDHNSGDWKRCDLWHSSYGKTPNGVHKPELLGPAIWIAAPILLRTGVKAEAEALFYMAGSSDEALMRSIPLLAGETEITEALLDATNPLYARSLILERIRDEKKINASYKHVDGTSFAAPILSSIIAQMLQANPALKPGAIKTALTRTAERIVDVPNQAQGYGVVRADKAVKSVLKKKRIKKRVPRPGSKGRRTR